MAKQNKTLIIIIVLLVLAVVGFGIYKLVKKEKYIYFHKKLPPNKLLISRRTAFIKHKKFWNTFIWTGRISGK